MHGYGYGGCNGGAAARGFFLQHYHLLGQFCGTDGNRGGNVFVEHVGYDGFHHFFGYCYYYLFCTGFGRNLYCPIYLYGERTAYAGVHGTEQCGHQHRRQHHAHGNVRGYVLLGSFHRS